MIIPIRCFSCGGFISDKWIAYLELVNSFRIKDGDVTEIELMDADVLKSKTVRETAEFKALKELNISRICCRRHFLTNVDLIESI
jgi:DNA-directed RNA polymerase I, II, and III subunit RPABC5